MIHTSNTPARRRVAPKVCDRSSKLSGIGWLVQITLEDNEGISTAIQYISYYDGFLTLYTPVRAEAKPLPHKDAVEAMKFICRCYQSVFPGIHHIKVQLVPAGRKS